MLFRSMAFNITHFRSSFRNSEPASPTNYEVVVIRPPKLVNGRTINSGYVDVENNLKYRCVACSLPGKMLNTSDRLTYGPNRKIVTNAIYQDVIFTYIVSDNMDEKNYFSKWHDDIIDNVNDSASPSDVKYYDDYIGSVKINQYSKEGGLPVLTIELEEAYPINVEEIPLSWDMNNDIVKINVTMAYRIWKRTNL